MIPELPKINSGFTSCYPKFSNKIRVLGISGLSIQGSGFAFFCPALRTDAGNQTCSYRFIYIWNVEYGLQQKEIENVEADLSTFFVFGCLYLLVLVSWDAISWCLVVVNQALLVRGVCLVTCVQIRSQARTILKAP
jgi:hypothetical protein